MHVLMTLVTCQFLQNMIDFICSNQLTQCVVNILEQNEHTDNELGYCMVRVAHFAHKH